MVDIKKIVIKAISDASVQNAEGLREDISLADQGVDSLGMFTIIMNVQDACEIEIPDSDLEKLNSISNFVDYLSAKLA
ncbi:MAG: phosphopantetheine-binding protein [Pseudomonadota bacterium]|nr:phosphopantetheine-binding protein [Pseudomonadota bacterium]